MNSPTTAPFDTEAGFRQAIDTIIASASRELRIFDRSLQRIDLEQKDRAEALEAFLGGARDRRVGIVVQDPDHCERYCPRLQNLLRRFGLTFEFRQAPLELAHLSECFLLADKSQAVIRFHVDQPRGKIILDDGDEVHPWWQRHEELWTMSSPCLSPTRLGL